jgi:hypothetical protein
MAVAATRKSGERTMLSCETETIKVNSPTTYVTIQQWLSGSYFITE